MIEPYLDDARWARIEPKLCGKQGDPGCSARDNRLFIEAVFWVVRNNAAWRHLPPRFGKWFTAYTRFRRWTKKGVWPRVFAALAEDGAFDYALIGKSLQKIPSRRAEAEREPPTDRAAA